MRERKKDRGMNLAPSLPHKLFIKLMEAVISDSYVCFFLRYRHVGQEVHVNKLQQVTYDRIFHRLLLSACCREV